MSSSFIENKTRSYKMIKKNTDKEESKSGAFTKEIIFEGLA